MTEKLRFELCDKDRKVVYASNMNRKHFPGIVVWGGRAFSLDDIQSASPAPAVYIQRETFVIGRDS